ncbi:MAG: imidazolonepropionase [Clostridia bacterium]
MKLFINISQLVTVSGFKAKKGKEMNDVAIITDGAIVTDNGKIVYVGKKCDLPNNFALINDIVDCHNHAVIPAFIDSHTHLVFGGFRADEFNMRMRGASYMEIMNAGGGIEATTKLTRNNSEQQLFDAAMILLNEMKKDGIATVEIKSGYGLDKETELKQLKVIEKLNKESGMRIIATFMGAHAIAKEFNKDADKYAQFVVNEVLPAVKAQGIAEFCDVFCEQGVFNAAQTTYILEKAKQLGLKPKIHADEIINSESASLAVSLGCASADHLLHVSDKGINDLANSNTIATLLPATAFSLKENYAPARKLIDGGAGVAIASDCNPGSCFCNSFPFLTALSTINMGLTVNETITALTLNAAAAIDKADIIGSIDIGKAADFILLKWNDINFLSYHIASNCVEKLYISGNEIK